MEGKTESSKIRTSACSLAGWGGDGGGGGGRETDSHKCKVGA